MCIHTNPSRARLAHPQSQSPRGLVFIFSWLQHWAGVYVTLMAGKARDIVVKGYQPCCHKLVPCLHPDITPLVPLEGSKHDITFEDIQKAYLRANLVARLGKFLLYTIPVAQLILAIVITTQSSACWVRRVRGLHYCNVAFYPNTPL